MLSNRWDNAEVTTASMSYMVPTHTRSPSPTVCLHWLSEASELVGAAGLDTGFGDIQYPRYLDNAILRIWKTCASSCYQRKWGCRREVLRSDRV